MDLSLAKSLSHMRRSESWRSFARGVGGVVRRVGSVKNLVGKSARSSTATPLDWYCVFGVQALSMVSILSTTYIFSTAVFMCKFWGARDDADASLRAGVVIAAKPAFSAISSYPWGIAGDKAGFRATMLLSAFATMLLTAALGCVRSFAWAVVVRAASGLFDGVMTNSRSCMAKISDRTNAARAFSTFGITYGLGSTIAPTLSALLAYPCGGGSGDVEDGTSTDTDAGLFDEDECPTPYFRDYPFFLSSAWVLVAGAMLWTFAFAYLRVPGESARKDGAARGGYDRIDDEGGDGEGEIGVDVERGGGGGSGGKGEGAEVEMSAAATSARPRKQRGTPEKEDGEGLLPDVGACDSPRSSASESSVAVVRMDGELANADAADAPATVVAETEDDRAEAETSALLRGGDGPDDDADTETEEDETSTDAEATPWHEDRTIKLAVINQVACTFAILTGAELTPIWMATRRENGGLGFSAIDIGIFGSVMGVSILLFSAFLFSYLSDRYGATRSVTWALFLNGVVYLAHPLAAYAIRSSRALTWTLIVVFAMCRGCMGPVVMGGVSLILNNSSPRGKLGAVNGFSGAFTNVARAAAPILSGGLIAGMVHATRELRRSKSEDGDDVKGDVALFFAEGFNPTWWPFTLLGVAMFILARFSGALPKSLDFPNPKQ